MSARVLVIEQVASNRILMRARLAAACHSVTAVAALAEAQAVLRQEGADAVVMDLDPAQGDAAAFIAALRADHRHADLPVIALAPPDRPGLRLAALAAGADDVVDRGVSDAVLMARLRALLRHREALSELAPADPDLRFLGLSEPAAVFEGRGTVALVTTRPEATLRLRRELSALLPDRLLAMSRSDAMAGPAAWGSGAVPDVFVVDGDLDGPGGGLRLLSDLRSLGATRHACFCLLVGAGDPATEAMAFDLGAHDVSLAEADPRELALRLAALLRRKRHAERLRTAVRDGLRLAVTDPLTGLHNRRYAVGQLAGMVGAARAEGTTFAVMVIDLDRFKSVNDRHGHAAGDAVLVAVATRLSRCLRPGDLLARIGGEEFLVALPATGAATARALAERLCTAVQEAPYALPDGASLRMTASIGVALGEASALPVAAAVQAEIDRADRALMAAKAAGRNNVCLDRTAA